MRLIDVDALRKEIDSVNYYGYDPEVSRICGLINDAPTIDAVEVVRCRDCKFYDRHYEYCHNYVFGDGHGYYPPPCTHDDDYCSFGVRREDGEA